MTAFGIVPSCPLCQALLVDGPMRVYETMWEHVSDPNGTSPARPTLVCPDSMCRTQQYGIFWDPEIGTDDFYWDGPLPVGPDLAKLRGAK